MFHVRSLLGAGGLAVILVLAIPSATLAEFVILQQSVLTDSVAQEITFALTFSEPPDFFDADAAGRPRHAFQYFFDTDPDASPEGFRFAGDGVSIIRGPEIRFDNDIPVRDSINDTGEEFPNAEGWGKARGSVPFALSGDELTFVVPWKMLGETDGRFSYHLLSFEFGSQTSEIASTSVSLPSPLKAGCALLAIAASVALRR